MDTVMTDILRVVFAIAQILCLISIPAYLVLALNRDTEILNSLRFSYWREIPLRRRAFFAIVGGALIVCLFVGAKTFLSWMPTTWGSVNEEGDYVQLADKLAAVYCVTCGSGIIVLAWRAIKSHYEVTELREYGKWEDRIQSAILDPGSLASVKRELTSAIEALRHEEEPMRNTDRLPYASRQKWRLLNRRIAQLEHFLTRTTKAEDQLTQLKEKVLSDHLQEEERREREQVELTRKQAELAEKIKRKEAAAQAIREFTAAVAVARARRAISYSETMEGLSEGKVFIADSGYVSKRWSEIGAEVGAQVNISESDIERCQKGPYRIERFYGPFNAIRMDEPPAVYAEYTGDYIGGRTSTYIVQKGDRVPVLSSLVFHPDVDGVIEAFYIAFELPKLGIFWHYSAHRE